MVREKIEVAEKVILATLNNEEKKTELLSAIKELDYEILNGPDNLGVLKLCIPKDEGILTAIKKLNKIKLLVNIEPEIIDHISVIANDTYYANQWAHPKISSPSAWNITTGSSSVIVGILDSGIPIQSSSLSHPDLNNSSRILLGNDYVTPDNEPGDDCGHGTHVAGIISAESNNSTGMAGVGWNTKLFIVKVFDVAGYGSSYRFYQGVLNAVDNNAKIINYSGSGAASYYKTLALNHAQNNDCLIIASAGNDYSGSVEYPAAYSTSYNNVMAISATNSSDNIAGFSNIGSQINVAAPGVSIFSTMPDYQVAFNDSGYNQNYDYMSGTSMAAPHVSGLAGLLLSINSSLTPLQIRTTIELSSEDLGTTGFDTLYGYGRIDAYETVKNLYVPDVCSTIASAVSAAVNGQTIVILSSETLSSDVSLPNGVSLTINSGVTINLSTYSIIADGGIIINNGTITGLRATLYDSNSNIRGLCATIQAACNNAEDYDDIYIEEGNFNENVTISGVDYLYMDSPSSQATKEFQSLTISSCDYFIGTGLSGLKAYVNNCYSPYFGACHMTTSGYSYSGYNLYNSALCGMVSTFAALKNYALFSQASDIDIENFYFWNSYYGIFATYYSDVYALTGEICSINNQDLSAIVNSDVDAYYCYYDNGTPSILEAAGGDVTTDFNYDCSTLGKKTDFNLSNANTDISTVTTGHPESEVYMKLRDSYTILKKQTREKIQTDKKFNLSTYHDDFLETAKEFKDFIINNPSEQYTKTALVLTVRCYQAAKEYETMKSFLEEIIGNKAMTDFKPIAKRMMIEYYRETKEYTKALDLADDLIKEYEQDTDYVCDLLYAKGLILAHETKNTEEAELCFNEIMQNHADNPITAMVSNELQILGKSVEEKDNIKTTEDIGITLDANPNPFNPIVNLSFNLSEEANVGIVVYDILGREIWNMQETYYVAGKHTVTWQGTNKLGQKVSTGTYIVQLKSDSFQITKKILLMK